MATARTVLIDPEIALPYHLVSRCVRRAWLCGWDRITRKDYTHRKVQLEQRLLRLVEAFAVDLYAYAIMSNHFHLVVFHDPKAYLEWSDEEVAERWVRAYAPEPVLEDAYRRACMKAAILTEPHRLDYRRRRLGSLSVFMQHLKQPIARDANREDAVKGHFFDQRFYSGALLDDDALLAAMAYVDLNPVRARIAKDIESCQHTAIARRLQHHTAHRLDGFLQPIASGLEKAPRPSISLRCYIARLQALIEITRQHPHQQKQPAAPDKRWMQHIATLSRPQRAFGAKDALEAWIEARQLRAVETPLA
ncbi:MAG: hypothetical protein K0U93_10630 [Gammaproteobacteria bacterium]|nr:hypothetical protein [Gammaproteobacteria bacterium]